MQENKAERGIGEDDVEQSDFWIRLLSCAAMVSCVQYAWMAGGIDLHVNLQQKAYEPRVCKRTDLSDLRGRGADGFLSAEAIQ